MINHSYLSLATLRAFDPISTFFLILIVFLTFRLLMPFVFRSGSYFVDQAPDIGDYLRWGTLADSGLYPFIPLLVRIPAVVRLAGDWSVPDQHLLPGVE